MQVIISEYFGYKLFVSASLRGNPPMPLKLANLRRGRGRVTSRVERARRLAAPSPPHLLHAIQDDCAIAVHALGPAF